MDRDRRSLTLKEAAKYCEMSEPIFREWAAVKPIAWIPSRPGSPRRKFRTAELDAFLLWLDTDEARNAQNPEKKENVGERSEF